MATLTLPAALAGATIALAVLAPTAAAASPWITPIEQDGVRATGRARNESCSITTTFLSADGRQHTVTVNQTPKWGGPTVIVPPDGQVTVVVNGTYHAPYLFTVDDSLPVVRPVPRWTPDGVDCEPEQATTSSTSTTGITPVTTRVTISDPPPTPQSTTTVATVDTPVSTVPVPDPSPAPGPTLPPPATSPPGIDGGVTLDPEPCGAGTLPCTGALHTAATVAVGVGMTAVGILAAIAAWVERRRGRR